MSAPEPGADSSAEPRPLLVVHGVATRDRDAFVAEVEQLGDALGPGVRPIPCYWGDLTPDPAEFDRILPYLGWTDAGGDVEADDPSAGEALRAALARRDPAPLLAVIGDEWRRRTESSRHRLLAGLYRLVRTQYLRASVEFTGDLLRYQRDPGAVHERLWEVLIEEAPGHGLAGRPVDVLTHSLGGSIAVDAALSGHPRLHIRHLITCATQVPFFALLDAAPGRIAEPLALPPTVGAWTNLFVALDPWAYLAGPVFRLHDGSAPVDLEVHGDAGDNRVLTHSAHHYWSHPTSLAAMRRALGIVDPGPESSTP
ncbi:MAG: hypothetical protein D6683_06460 [Actinomyces sp.]|nr:MAG: hypothetical protein D6683_06460 [Actinomyces sp.]